MRNTFFQATGLVAALVGASPAALAEKVTQPFGTSSYSLDLPAGYALEASGSPQSGIATFAFATKPRPDGTRGVIQVSLMDIDKVSPGHTVTIDELGTSMIESVRKRRADWTRKDGQVTVAGVKAKRFDWTGAADVPPAEAQAPAATPPKTTPSKAGSPKPEPPTIARPKTMRMRGVMIVGIKGRVAFTLSTQDMDPFAAKAVPLCDRALKTFTLTVEN